MSDLLGVLEVGTGREGGGGEGRDGEEDGDGLHSGWLYWGLENCSGVF